MSTLMVLESNIQPTEMRRNLNWLGTKERQSKTSQKREKKKEREGEIVIVL